MRPTRKLDERAEQGAAQRNLDGEHHQDEQDNKVKFDTKHEGADAASGVKRDVRRAERREDESRREAQNIAVRRCRRSKPVQVQVHGQRPTSSAANGLGSDAAVEVWNTAASLGERQARRRGNNTARGKEHRQRQRHHIQSRASASVEISEGRFPREGPSESHNGQSQCLKPEQ